MSRGAIARINLSALRHNLTVARQSAPQSKLIAAIKANGYGHGMVEVASALTDADMFAVACLSEAITLRESGIKKPILVLQGFVNASELEDFIRYHLTSVVHSEEQLMLLLKTELEGALSVWLKVDTGMHRLGLAPELVESAYLKLQAINNIQLQGVMTHFACADEIDNKKTRQQTQRFLSSVENIDADFSMANSAAILAWPETHQQWIRPGIMLFGASPFVNGVARQHKLKPVMTFNAKLNAIKTIEAGETVGYGASWTADCSTRVGVVSVGYGDGYPRHAKTGTPVAVNGVKTQLLGRVSMDLITVDLADIPARVGDVVELWGGQISADDVARCADTIAYELFTGITKRVEFTYLD